MKQEIEANDQIEIILNCNDYQNSISGSGAELSLVGFPIDWIESSPGDVESQSDIISEFVAKCSDEYMFNWGSYDEFGRSRTINMKVTLSDGTVIEGNDND